MNLLIVAHQDMMAAISPTLAEGCRGEQNAFLSVVAMVYARSILIGRNWNLGSYFITDARARAHLITYPALNAVRKYPSLPSCQD